MRRLGRSDIEISAIGLGCWQFSEAKGIAGGYWPALPQDLTDRIVKASLDAGVTWFDTAEAYGNGRSERALAKALAAAGRKNGEVVVATKWFPLLRAAGSIRATIGTRQACLAPFGINLHQVHQPFALASTAAQMNAMADLVEAGAIRTVGVSNFSAAKMRAAHAALAARGIPLVSNQMPFSLLDRRIETSGVLAAAKELGVTIIAYSPLAQGILTGRFHRDPQALADLKGPRKLRSWFRRSGIEKSRPLVAALEEIAKAHSATASQVALNWLFAFHGDSVVAIPGASSVRQAEDNAGAMRLTLTPAELRRIDELSRR